MNNKKTIEDKVSEIITKLVVQRKDIPSTFAIDGNLVDDAKRLVELGRETEAAQVLFYALCKEYGYNGIE